MKYIIMAGGKYDEFKTPKQLLEINGEVIIERTIRLLRENGITDIAISTNNPVFEYLNVPILKHNNEFVCNGKYETKSSKYCWLNAYYPTKEPCCYLHGDVYFSDNAIKTIVNAKVKNTMFFCTYDETDAVRNPQNLKGREPFAYKVENQEVFRYGINKIMEMVDNGEFDESLPPLSWTLYRFLNGYDVMRNAKTYIEVNNIFQSKGDYIVIDDYTTDIDNIDDIRLIEESLKR